MTKEKTKEYVDADIKTMNNHEILRRGQGTFGGRKNWLQSPGRKEAAISAVYGDMFVCRD